VTALRDKQHPIPKLPALQITAQGGVGTTDEHQFLLNHFKLSSVGWGTPFLLVPEAINLDPDTIGLLSKATEQDQYLSNTSPLGVPFHTLKGNTQDLEKHRLIDKGRPGSACPKKFLISNKEFTERPVCTASRQYQHAKLLDLETSDLSPIEIRKEQKKIMEKSCICVGLGNAALLTHHLMEKKGNSGVSVCPGPNIAYFTKTVSLRSMVDHIYGRSNILERQDRPNMFIKEFNLYLDYFKNKLQEANTPLTPKQQCYFDSFKENLQSGLQYYKVLFSRMDQSWNNIRIKALKDLNKIEYQLKGLQPDACQVSPNFVKSNPKMSPPK
jgi:hypothetical protein